MILDVNLPLILLAALVAAASPGPATLAIAGTSMASGRRCGLALASGITAGSLVWSLAAALGLGAVMASHAWMMEVVRYLGAGYLLYLALRCARSALAPGPVTTRSLAGSPRALCAKGLALHVTNPKAILFFGSLYSVAMPAGAAASQLALVIAAVGVQSFCVFHGYALIFSAAPLSRGYLKIRRGFEAVCAAGFGLASLKVLTARLHGP